MFHRVVVALAVSVLVMAGLAAPAQATQPSAKKYSSCAKLLDKYPNGVARNKKARNRIVKQGFERPKVRKKVFKENRKRLDKNNNGVLCEREKEVDAEQPEPDDILDGGVIYLPTGAPLIDAIYGSQAQRGDISEQQSIFVSAWYRTMESQDWTRICRLWRSQTFQDSFLDTTSTPDVAASSNLVGQEAWIRETAEMVTSLFCTNKGYDYSLMLP